MQKLFQWAMTSCRAYSRSTKRASSFCSRSIVALTSALICGASVFTACSNDDDNATQKGQLLEIFDVQGSAGKARLTVDGKVLFTTDVYVGKNGLGKTGEGDGKTPLGTL